MKSLMNVAAISTSNIYYHACKESFSLNNTFVCMFGTRAENKGTRSGQTVQDNQVKFTPVGCCVTFIIKELH